MSNSKDKYIDRRSITPRIAFSNKTRTEMIWALEMTFVHL